MVKRHSPPPPPPPSPRCVCAEYFFVMQYTKNPYIRRGYRLGKREALNYNLLRTYFVLYKESSFLFPFFQSSLSIALTAKDKVISPRCGINHYVVTSLANFLLSKLEQYIARNLLILTAEESDFY